MVIFQTFSQMASRSRKTPVAGAPLVFRLLFLIVALARPTTGETIARHGKGWLESIEGYQVLHLKGSHFEMGEQHGVLLRDSIRENLNYILEQRSHDKIVDLGPVQLTAADFLASIIHIQKPHVPPKYFEELRGLSRGAGVDLDHVQAANFIPELFHCSGFAVMNSATKGGVLYHGRVLDYGIDLKLQEHAVLIVAEPDGGIPFVNVGYAGFIGSVTGMNAEHISIGEMGGGGLGHWDGVPMALLVREVLESARDLEAAADVFRTRPRTCEYYFVVADGQTNQAVAIEASWNRFALIQPGQADQRLPRAVADTVVLSAGDRYDALVDRIESNHGRITADSAIRLMDRPVATRSNLHNALFEPRSTQFWVANASPAGKPAAEQKYFHFTLTELLSRKP